MNSNVSFASKCAAIILIFANFGTAQVPDGCFPFDISIPPEFGTFPDISEEHCNHDLFRTINGTYNDPVNIDEGRAGILFERFSPASYDGNGETMINRANPRTVSNEIFAQESSIPSQAGLSSLVFTFLQFIDHDITLVREGENEFVPIQVPSGDPEFDPFGTGQVIIPFTRSHFEEGTGTSESNPREQNNLITSWVDGSVIYGSDLERATWLRAFEGGKLKAAASSHGPILPYNTVDGFYDSPIDPDAPRMAGDRDRQGNPVKVFVSGDVRANEQPGLTSLHILFMKEHNRICNELIDAGSTDDEFNYQYARKMVGALIQNILFNEVLPTLGIYFSTDAYEPSRSPNIFNEFASSAYRLGHTMITDEMDIIFAECQGTDFVPTATLPLKDGFFNPNIIADFGIEPVIRGLYNQRQENIDAKVVDAARNFLFGSPGAGGMDLVSLNIQRGRDHGIPDFNSLRESIGLTPVSNFSQITDDQELQVALEGVYGDVNNIDAWVGLLSEKKFNGTPLGETLHLILKLQFENILRADRFYFWRDPLFDLSTKLEIYATRFGDVIKRNSDIEAIQSVFYWQGNCLASENYCEPEAEGDNGFWVQRTLLNSLYNATGNNNGFADFSGKVVRFQKEIPNCFIMETQTSGLQARTYGKVFIDFNRDGDFSSDEVVFDKSKTRYFSGYIRIPDQVLKGTTRVRVITSSEPIPDGCSNVTTGETEDYTLIIE